MERFGFGFAGKPYDFLGAEDVDGFEFGLGVNVIEQCAIVINDIHLRRELIEL